MLVGLLLSPTRVLYARGDSDGRTPAVCTSFWRRVTPADSLLPGFRVVYEGTKPHYVIPVREWTCRAGEDSYHAFHHHGVALESEYMAYRIYFDRKQTVDIYAKRTPRLELPVTYWYPSDEQFAAHYGQDVLRVSGYVGVGAVKPWNGSKMVHFDSVESRTQRIVSCMRRCAVVEMVIRGWQNGDQYIDSLTVRYTLCAGERAMRCEIFCSQPVENLCTGVQQVGRWDKERQTHSGAQCTAVPYRGGQLLTSWGTDFPDNDTVRFAPETVGLAVWVPRRYAAAPVADVHNNLCLLRLRPTRHGWYATFRLTAVALLEDNPPSQDSLIKGLLKGD